MGLEPILPVYETGFLPSLNYISTGAPAEIRTPDTVIMEASKRFELLFPLAYYTGGLPINWTNQSHVLCHLSYRRIVDCYLCTDGQSLHPQAYIYEKPYQNLAWLELKSWRIKELDFVEMYWIWTNISDHRAGVLTI